MSSETHDLEKLRDTGLTLSDPGGIFADAGSWTATGRMSVA